MWIVFIRLILQPAPRTRQQPTQSPVERAARRDSRAMLKFKVGDLVSYRPNSAHSCNAAHGVCEIGWVLRGVPDESQQRATERSRLQVSWLGRDNSSSQ